jgi:hypothetical protein
MKSRMMLLACLMVLVPGALAAQDAEQSAEARVEAALQTALEAGIPVSLLESKIAEGKARGVDMDRIAAAVEARLAGLTRARDAFAEAQLTSTTEGELAIGADALEAGVSATALATISETAPQERRTVAIAVLTDLVALGHVSEEALARVEAALERGPAALNRLRTESSAQLQARGGMGVTVPAEAGARIEIRTRRPGS